MTGPLIEVVPEPRDDPNEEARLEALARWVEDRLRPDYSWLWPEQTGSKSKPVPWPRCWRLHPGLVAELQMAMDWRLELRDGNGSYREGFEWESYLRAIIKADVHDIALRICADGHVDASVPRRPRESQLVPAPVLPWARELA